MADKAVQELERIYTIPLREVKTSPRNHRADRAIRAIRSYLSKHMKAEEIWIDTGINEMIWDRGMYTIPSRIRVRARKFDDGVVEVSLPESEQTGSFREELRARREKEGEKEEKKEAKKGKDEGEAAQAKPETPEPAVAAGPGKKTPWPKRKVIDIEGIGPKYDAELAKVDIRLMDQLLAADAKELAKTTGISQTLLETWQGMADLDRLDSVNNQYAELLVRSSITRVEQLADLTPEHVVRQVNQYLATVERAPTTQPVTEAMAGLWIQEARTQAGRPSKGPATQAKTAPAKKPDGPTKQGGPGKV